MIINGRAIGPDHLPYVIAEAGIGHAGNVDIAMGMIRAAHEAGADAVKFQTHTEDELSDVPQYPENAGGESIQSIITRCSLSEESEARLKAYADSLGITYLSTPFTVAAVDRLTRLNVAAFKIGSGNVLDKPLLEAVAIKNKPVILSTGMHHPNEIMQAANLLRSHGARFAVLACTSEYPTPWARARLRRIQDLRNWLRSVPVGFSCHSPGIWTALASVAMGGCIVEKHFVTADCPKGPDDVVSISTAELRDLVVGVKAVWYSCRNYGWVNQGEEQTRAWFMASRRK
jgi:sialic acid synthase SpsE